jgi:hypothetical protein
MRSNNMIPVERDRSHDLGDILVADSGLEPFWDKLESGISVKIFRTGFAIYRDEAWLASFEDHFENEFRGLTPRAARDARVTEAVSYANRYLEQTSDAGLYDGRKTDYSKRPN